MLVRCTCISNLIKPESRVEAEILVYDPQCDYIMHRLEAESM